MIESEENTDCYLSPEHAQYGERTDVHPTTRLTNRARDVGLIYLVTLEAFVQVTRYPHGS